MDLALIVMRDKVHLQEAALIVMNWRPELAITGKLLTSTAQAPFGCDEVKRRYGDREDPSAEELVMPKLPVETMSDERGPSGSRKSKERDDEEQEDRQPVEPIEQGPEQAAKDDGKASVGGVSSVDVSFLDEDETVAGTTEPADNETSTMEPLSFMTAAHNLPENSSHGKNEITANFF